MKVNFKLFLLLFILVAALSLGQQVTMVYQLEADINDLSQQREELAAETVSLRQELSDLDNLSYVEILARQKLNMIYPGETLYIEAEMKK